MTVIEENALRAIAHGIPKIACELEKMNRLKAVEIMLKCDVAGIVGNQRIELKELVDKIVNE